MRFFLIILVVLGFLHSKEIRFSTLLTDRTSNIELEYRYMLDYLNKKTPYDFKFIYNTSYQDLVKKFGSGDMDIVALDAIEYIKLKRFFPFAKAFIAFYDDKLSKFYTCVGVTKNKNIKDIVSVNTNTTLRIHDKHTTCGYDIMKYIFKQDGKKIENFEYKNVGIDDDVILEIILNPKNLGFEKSNTIDKYTFFHFYTIKTGFKVPALAFIANTHNVSKEVMDNIANAFLALKPTSNQEDKDHVKTWNYNMQNGSFIPNEKDYAHLYKILHELETSKDKK